MAGDGAESQKDKSEMMDIVDDNNVVIGTMPRSQAYAENHRKRIVYIFVIDPVTHELGFAVRSKTVSWRPLNYTATAGGHVGAGELPYDAAMREMFEEIGIATPLYLIDQGLADDPTNQNKFYDYMFVTFATFDDMVLDPEEVDHIEFMPLEQAKIFFADAAIPQHPKLQEQLLIVQSKWADILALLA